jgi:hypothetical protein
MFLRGFLFALGFCGGSFVFTVSVAIAILAIEKLVLHFRRPKKIDGIVDIRHWQERKFAGNSS